MFSCFVFLNQKWTDLFPKTIYFNFVLLLQVLEYENVQLNICQIFIKFETQRQFWNLLIVKFPKHSVMWFISVGKQAELAQKSRKQGISQKAVWALWPIVMTLRGWEGGGACWLSVMSVINLELIFQKLKLSVSLDFYIFLP